MTPLAHRSLRLATLSICAPVLTCVAATALAGTPDVASEPYECVASVEAAEPPPLPEESCESDYMKPLCGEGLVPAPIAQYAPKGRPGMKRSKTISSSAYYYYADMFQTTSKYGVAATISLHSPRLGYYDYHTLAEISAGSSDGSDMVEVGWTVDVNVNGDSAPHLFVFHWIDGDPQCYNGCGWVQVSSSRYPGMELDAEDDDSDSFTIVYYYGNWWVGFQGEWIGYYPGSRWGSTYTKVELAQWFGEVASYKSWTCTDMGAGRYSSSSSSAWMENMYLVNSDGSHASASPAPLETRERFYNVSDFNSESKGFSFGGPGGC